MVQQRIARGVGQGMEQARGRDASQNGVGKQGMGAWELGDPTAWAGSSPPRPSSLLGAGLGGCPGKAGPLAIFLVIIRDHLLADGASGLIDQPPSLRMGSPSSGCPGSSVSIPFSAAPRCSPGRGAAPPLNPSNPPPSTLSHHYRRLREARLRAVNRPDHVTRMSRRLDACKGLWSGGGKRRAVVARCGTVPEWHRTRCDRDVLGGQRTPGRGSRTRTLQDANPRGPLRLPMRCHQWSPDHSMKGRPSLPWRVWASHGTACQNKLAPGQARTLPAVPQALGSPPGSQQPAHRYPAVPSPRTPFVPSASSRPSPVSHFLVPTPHGFFSLGFLPFDEPLPPPPIPRSSHPSPRIRRSGSSPSRVLPPRISDSSPPSALGAQSPGSASARHLRSFLLSHPGLDVCLTFARGGCSR